MTRKEAIKDLDSYHGRFLGHSDKQIYEALYLAKASLKTDEAYQLEYENRDSEEVIRCKDCKFFEYDHLMFTKDTILITAHEICTKWGDGCKTNENGWCYLAEAKTDGGKENERL